MRRRAILIPVILLVCASETLAQQRFVERRPWSHPEGRLMAYYSAALAFSPVGAPVATEPWLVSAALELSYIPPLSRDHRTSGGTKTQNTNLAPVLPRPRIAVTLPAHARVEVSWVPPLHAFDLTANLWGVSLALPVASVRSVTLSPRIAASGGRVTGAITCNRRLRENGGGDSVYYRFICHDRESEDHFEPLALSGELLAHRTWRGGTLVPYGGVGVRAEHTRLDVGVLRSDGSRDADHPILDMRLTRGYAFAGAAWMLPRRARLNGELFWAPGSLVTVRVSAGLGLRER